MRVLQKNENDTERWFLKKLTWHSCSPICPFVFFLCICRLWFVVVSGYLTTKKNKKVVKLKRTFNL